MIGDWIVDNLGWVLVGTLVLMAAFFVAAVDADSKARNAFMRECLQDHKQYECTAMWRAGERHERTTVVPVFVPHR